LSDLRRTKVWTADVALHKN